METTPHMLNRRKVVSDLLNDRNDDLLVVAGLGSATWDVCAAGEHENNFCFIGAMGQAAPFALGLSLAQAQKRVLLITGDGEILMSLGILATIANQTPQNLSVVVLDNHAYGETGGQQTATAGVTNLELVASGAGFGSTMTVTEVAQLADLKARAVDGQELFFATVKVLLEDLPLCFPYSFDGVTAMNRFRNAVLGENV